MLHRPAETLDDWLGRFLSNIKQVRGWSPFLICPILLVFCSSSGRQFDMTGILLTVPLNINSSKQCNTRHS